MHKNVSWGQALHAEEPPSAESQGRSPPEVLEELEARATRAELQGEPAEDGSDHECVRAGRCRHAGLQAPGRETCYFTSTLFDFLFIKYLLCTRHPFRRLQLINIDKAFIKVIFQSRVEETYTTKSSK